MSLHTYSDSLSLSLPSLSLSLSPAPPPPVDNTEALRLRKDVRVLVWVMTSPKSLDRAHAVKSTWGQHADKDLLLFMSSVKDPSLPTIALNVSEGRDHLTAKTMRAFDYIYRHHFHKADFFMKVLERVFSLSL